ncbi:hypothetical protein E2C01_007659 [Portunus trituberculatus]|uniref:Uncharacterized protein n=1 Tax=Portunus trituberculatus TaxID=210409 RepID=A0A5B7D109_PORTR|nr:hypothetical protein [Portunus trituberculatus]
MHNTSPSVSSPNTALENINITFMREEFPFILKKSLDTESAQQHVCTVGKESLGLKLPILELQLTKRDDLQNTSDLGGCQLCKKKNECGLRWCGWRGSCVAVHAGPPRTRQSALSPPAAMLPQDSRQVVVATDY